MDSSNRWTVATRTLAIIATVIAVVALIVGSVALAKWDEHKTGVEISGGKTGGYKPNKEKEKEEDKEKEKKEEEEKKKEDEAAGLGGLGAPNEIPGPLVPGQAQGQGQGQAEVRQMGAGSQVPEIPASVALAWMNGNKHTATLIVVSPACGHCVHLKSDLQTMAANGALAGAGPVGLLPASEARKLHDKLPVKAYPHMFKVRHGRVLEDHLGYMPPDSMAAFLKRQ